MSALESEKTGFQTQEEPHPSELVEGGHINQKVNVDELRKAIPAYCFQPSLNWSIFYLARDLIYSSILVCGLIYALQTRLSETTLGYYTIVNIYAFCQGIVFTGLWVIAHDCGHSAFSKSGTVNDTVGFTLHSSLLAPYFSWKSTHRRHHIYANHIEKDLNYVPPNRNEYTSMLGLHTLQDIGQDAPVVLFLRILLQQAIGWNWYILSNITCPPSAVVKKGMSMWRHSHFDPWGALFRCSEVKAVILSDVGCFTTLIALYGLARIIGYQNVLWGYIMPWAWLNHWIVMITYLHHTHPKLPKYTPESWTFVRGATATIDRDFGIIGTHFMHHISSDHVTHHLFSKIPHYYTPVASKAIIPLLGNHYHGRGKFRYEDLQIAFRDCQWVEKDLKMDQEFGLQGGEKNRALWYRGGISPSPEYKMRGTRLMTKKAI